MNDVSDNSTEMTGIVVESYVMARFRLLVCAWLKTAKNRIPELQNIVDILPEDLGGSTNNKCDCEDKKKHYIRYLYKLILENGIQINVGARCLTTLGYPLSMTRRLEKIRRIIQRDIDTVEILEEKSARAVTNIYQTWAQVIIENKYLPGLLFLKDFGAIMNEFIECGRNLPQWLSFSLKSFYKRALFEQPSLQKKRSTENRIKYEKQWLILHKVNNLIWGRDIWIKELLQKIDTGEELSVLEINKINLLEANYNQGIVQKTEEAIPFLTSLINGSIVLTRFDSEKVPNRDKPIFLSFYNYMQHNTVLTNNQLTLLRKKFKEDYVKQFKKLPNQLKMMTQELVTIFKALDPELEQEKMQEIKTILIGRNVDLDFLAKLPI